jgi:phospholipase D-like protein
MVADVFTASFLTLLFWLPLVFLWFAVLVDILRRRDLSGVAIAVWLVAIIVFPFVGAIVYFIRRPRVSDAPAEAMMASRDPGQSAQMH